MYGRVPSFDLDTGSSLGCVTWGAFGDSDSHLSSMRGGVSVLHLENVKAIRVVILRVRLLL